MDYRQHDKYVGCGWVSSLLQLLSSNKDIEIGVVFYSEKVDKLIIDEESNPVQFVIPSYLNRLEKVMRNIKFMDFLWEERAELLQLVLDKFSPDVIHVFGTENPFGLIAIKTRIPVLIHLQGILNPIVVKWFPNGYNNLDVLKKTSLVNIFKFSGLWADYVKYRKMVLREEKIFYITKYFSGRTDWDKRIVNLMSKSSKYYHCDEILRPVFYLHQWQKKSLNKSIQLISIANPNLYKGIETIFETAKLLQKYTRHKLLWNVAGITHDNLMVKMFSSKTKIDPNLVGIKFMGPLPEATVVDKMLEADMFIHASHIDNSPNSLCEAMILGMPIISTNVGGIQSLITDKVEGILVQDGDAFGLAGAINDLIENQSDAFIYGARAREKALNRHDPQTIVNKQLLIYRDILKINDV